MGIPTFVNQDSAVEWQVGLTSGNIKRARRIAPSYSVSTGLLVEERIEEKAIEKVCHRGNGK